MQNIARLLNNLDLKFQVKIGLIFIQFNALFFNGK